MSPTFFIWEFGRFSIWFFPHPDYWMWPPYRREWSKTRKFGSTEPMSIGRRDLIIGPFTFSWRYEEPHNATN